MKHKILCTLSLICFCIAGCEQNSIPVTIFFFCASVVFIIPEYKDFKETYKGDEW